MTAEDDSWARYVETLQVLERFAGHPMRPAGGAAVIGRQTPDGPLSCPSEPMILEMEIEERLAHLNPIDRFEIDNALEGWTLQGKYELIELFFAEE